jgi:hypothetical protein
LVGQVDPKILAPVCAAQNVASYRRAPPIRCPSWWVARDKSRR